MLENYSDTKCPKCSNTSFELVGDVPTDSSFELTYLRCKSCKTLINSIPFYDTNSILDEIRKGINKLLTNP